MISANVIKENITICIPTSIHWPFCATCVYKRHSSVEDIHTDGRVVGRTGGRTGGLAERR